MPASVQSYTTTAGKLAELRKRVASQCGIPVFVGTPPPAAR